MLMKLFIRISK